MNRNSYQWSKQFMPKKYNAKLANELYTHVVLFISLTKNIQIRIMNSKDSNYTT